MKINRDLMTAIKEKAPQKYTQNIYRAIGRIKNKYLTDEETAAFIYARELKIDISKLTDRENLDRIRTIIKEGEASIPKPKKAGKGAKRSSPRTVYVGRTFKIKDPILPAKVVNEAKKMAENVYPWFYVLENSMRELIKKVLSDSICDEWWEKGGPPNKIKEKVDKRIEDEDKIPFHGKRGQHPIYYTDFGHLERIISKNWKYFEPIIGDLNWFRQHVKELEPSRNVIAHNNPLSSTDEGRVKLFFEVWERLIADKKDLIPD